VPRCHVRFVSAGCCAGILISGCGHQGAAGTANSAPPPPPPKPDATSLILSIDDVQRIAGVNDLADPQGGKNEPSHFPHLQIPGPCLPAYHEDVAFGTDWAQFRTVAYATDTNRGPGQATAMVDIIQAAGVYRDASSARAAFDRVAAALTACADLDDPRYGFGVNKKDPATLAVDTGQWKRGFRVKSAVLVEVSAIGFPASEQVVSGVLQTITDRIS
jgi:hypothetical protein